MAPSHRVARCAQRLSGAARDAARRAGAQEQGMLGRAPEEVAKFLAKTSGLDKTMIGEFLGEREEGCLRVMHAYVDAMDFAGSDFDSAIRCGCTRVLCRPARVGLVSYSVPGWASALEGWSWLALVMCR